MYIKENRFVHLRWKGHSPSNHWGTISSTPITSLGGKWGPVIFHVWARKTKVIRLPFPLQGDGCEAMPEASTGYIPPRGEGEGGKLSDSELRSLLCHRLLERYDCTPAITQGLWKSHHLCQSSLVGVSQGYI